MSRYKTFDLIDPCGKANKPGYKIRCYRVPLSWVQTYPLTVEEYQKTQTNPSIVAGDSVRLHGDIILDPTNAGEGKFAQFDIRIDSGKSLFAMAGEKGTGALTSSSDFQVEGNGPEQLEFANESLKPCYMYIFDLRNGETITLGEPGSPAYVESLEGDGGAVAGDFVGATYKVSCSEPYKFYYGAIDLTENPQ